MVNQNKGPVMKGKILKILKKEKGIVSGEALSSELGISRVSIWKHVRKLQELGYNIITTSMGYRLIGSIDALFPWEFPDRESKIHFFPEVTSTMDIAGKFARKGCPHFTVVIAGLQTKGRGRLRRAWHALQGKPDPTLEFFTREHCERFIDVVGGAVSMAWPDKQDSAQVAQD